MTNNSGGTASYYEEGSLEFDPGSYTVLYVIITLAIGIIAREVNKRTGIPYTPMLIIVGGFLGGVPHFGYISNSTEFAMQIDPHAILIILLPILIFESSFNAHIEVLAKNFWQVIILVVPGVMMSSFLLGLVIYYVLDYTDVMSFSSSLVLGSILATTDPVAVVALLKSLGAPLHIETLIEMESLFNDGVAMVFFELFIKLAQGETFNFGEAVGEFCLMAFGGPAVGFAFSIGALIVLNLFTRGTTLFISILVLLSYSVFLFCEKFLEGKVSGILAILICGISMNLWAKDYMTNTQKSAVGILLGYLQHISETILFFLSGIFVGDNLINDNTGKSEFSTADEIEGSDWWKTFVLYLFLQLSRVFMFVIFMYPLKKIGEGMTWKEAYVAMWGGLRGALAIALALIVYADESHEDGITRRQQNLILFHTCAVASLTLLLNGTTCGTFVEWLGIIENVNIKQKFKQNYLKEVKQEAIRQKILLKNTSYFDQVEWKGVDELVNLKELERKQGWADLTHNWVGHNKQKKEKKYANQLVHQLKHITQDMQPSVINNKQNYNPISQALYSNRDNYSDGKKGSKLIKSSKTLSKFDKFQAEKFMMIRYEFLRIFMKCLAFSKSKEWISNRVFTLIYDSAEECCERLIEPISMWHILEESLASKRYQRFLKAGTKFCMFRLIFDYILHSEIEFIHEMVYIYVSTINDAKVYIKEIQGQKQTTKKIQDWNLILQEIDNDYKKAKDYLQYVKKHNFELLGKLEQRKAAIKIIMAQAKMVDEHIRNKFIPEKEGNEIKEYLSGKLAVLYSIRTLVKLTSISQDMIKVYFKDTLDENEIDFLLTNRKEIEFETDELILDLDMIADYVYYIQTGEIEVTITTEGTNQITTMTFIQGQVVGLTNLVDAMEQSLIRLVAKDETNCILLPISELREFYFNNDKFESFCLKQCFYQFLHLFSKVKTEKVGNTEEDELWEEWEVKNPDQIQQIANESTVIRLDEGEKIFLEFGGYLYSGQMTNAEKDKTYFEYELLKSEVMYEAEELCTLLQFNKPYIKQSIKAQMPEQLNVNHYKKGDPLNESQQRKRNYASISRKISTLNNIEYMSQDNPEKDRQKYIDHLNWVKKNQVTKPMHRAQHKLENDLTVVDPNDAAIVKNPGNQGDQDDMEENDSQNTGKYKKQRSKRKFRPSQMFEDSDSQMENMFNNRQSSRKYSQASIDRGLMGRRGSFEANRIQIMEQRNKELRENQSQQKVRVIKNNNNKNQSKIEENPNDEKDESSGTQNIQELKKESQVGNNTFNQINGGLKQAEKNKNFDKNVYNNINNQQKNQNGGQDIHNIYDPSDNNILQNETKRPNESKEQNILENTKINDLNRLDDKNLNHADIGILIQDEKNKQNIDPEKNNK